MANSLTKCLWIKHAVTRGHTGSGQRIGLCISCYTIEQSEILTVCNIATCIACLLGIMVADLLVILFYLQTLLQLLKAVVVTGTDSGVGITWVAAGSVAFRSIPIILLTTVLAFLCCLRQTEQNSNCSSCKNQPNPSQALPRNSLKRNTLKSCLHKLTEKLSSTAKQLFLLFID